MIQVHHIQARLPPCGPRVLTGQEVGGPGVREREKGGTRKRRPAWGNRLCLIGGDTDLVGEAPHGPVSTLTRVVHNVCPGPTRGAFELMHIEGQPEGGALRGVPPKRLSLLPLPRRTVENLGGRPTASPTHQSLKPPSGTPGPGRREAAAPWAAGHPRTSPTGQGQPPPGPSARLPAPTPTPTPQERDSRARSAR